LSAADSRPCWAAETAPRPNFLQRRIVPRHRANKRTEACRDCARRSTATAPEAAARSIVCGPIRSSLYEHRSVLCERFFTTPTRSRPRGSAKLAPPGWDEFDTHLRPLAWFFPKPADDTFVPVRRQRLSRKQNGRGEI